MPLTATPNEPTAHSGRMAIGIWMQDENKSPVRVFVSYEALSQIDPSKVRDLHAALEIFDANRARIEHRASVIYDVRGADEDGEHEGQPILILRSNDID
jgi:hypothetical protein